MQISNYIIEESTSVIEAMKIIDKGGRATVFICTNKKLLASVSDGDVRRYIIANGDLNAPVSTIANYSPLYIRQYENENAVKLMSQYGISALPILNDENELLDIIFSNSRIENKEVPLNMPVVIMAGGKGTRLQPFTQILPKPLIPVGDKTITEHIMERFERYDCTKFDMIVNYKKNFIISYFCDSEIQHNVSFISETEFLGTAGGLKLVQGHYDNTFFITNCDVLIEGDYAAMVKQHKEQKNIITLVCAMKKMVVPYGTVELSENGHVAALKEKPQFDFITSTGLYIVEPAFLEKIPSNTFIHITDVIQKCIEKGENVGMFPIADNAWMDMGQLDGLERMKLCIDARSK